MEKTEKFDWLKYCFHAYFITWITGAFIEIRYHNPSSYIFGAVIILMVTFSIGALIEVWKGGLSRMDKIMYTIGFIFVNFLAAILFMVNRQKINKPAEPK